MSQPMSQPPADSSPEELQARIEEQREQLADTIDALTAKLDVKSHAQAKVDDVKAQAQAKATDAKRTVTETTMTPDGKPRPEAIAAAVALVVVAVLVMRWRRR